MKSYFKIILCIVLTGTIQLTANAQNKSSQTNEKNKVSAFVEKQLKIPNDPGYLSFIKSIKENSERQLTKNDINNLSERYWQSVYYSKYEKKDVASTKIANCTDGSFENNPLPNMFYAGEKGSISGEVECTSEGLDFIPLETSDWGPSPDANITLMNAFTQPQDPLIPSLNTTHTGTKSVRINQDNTLFEVDKLIKRVILTQRRETIGFWFALVFENPSGHMDRQPYFTARAIRERDNVILDEFCVASDPRSCLLTPVTVNGTNLTYADWSCGNLTVEGNVNDVIRLEFIAADCGLGGHFGYAYVDDICSNCSTQTFGDIDFEGVDEVCDEFPIEVCGTYASPILDNISGVADTFELQIIKNGVDVTQGNIALTNHNPFDQTFCFTVNSNNFPTNETGDFEFKATIDFNFGASCENSVPVTALSTNPGPDFTIGCEDPIDCSVCDPVVVNTSINETLNSLVQNRICGRYSITGSEADTGNCYRTTIDWGDGSVNIISQGETLVHNYASNGNYTININMYLNGIEGANCTFVSRDVTVNCHDENPCTDCNIAEVQQLLQDASNSFQPGSDCNIYSVTNPITDLDSCYIFGIDWGDGAFEFVQPNTTINHNYNSNNSYNVSFGIYLNDRSICARSNTIATVTCDGDDPNACNDCTGFPKVWGSSQNVNQTEIVTNSNGDIYVLGRKHPNANIECTTGGSNAFIAKYNDCGALVWKKDMNPISLSLKLDPSENVILQRRESNNVFVEKLNPNGDVIWSNKLYVNPGIQYWDRAIDVDEQNGDIYLALNSNSPIITIEAQNGNYIAAGNYQSAIVKFNSNGNYAWRQNITSVPNNMEWSQLTISSIEVAENLNRVYVNGFYDGAIQFENGNGLNENGRGSTAFFAYLNKQNGNYITGLNYERSQTPSEIVGYSNNDNLFFIADNNKMRIYNQQNILVNSYTILPNRKNWYFDQSSSTIYSTGTSDAVNLQGHKLFVSKMNRFGVIWTIESPNNPQARISDRGFISKGLGNNLYISGFYMDDPNLRLSLTTILEGSANYNTHQFIAKVIDNGNSGVLRPLTEDEFENTSIKVAPNPASNRFKISTNSRDKHILKYVLLDIYGNVLKEGDYHEELNQNGIKIPASVKSGLYFVKVLINTDWHVEKLIIKK